jgi:hypothetical protein
VTSIVDSYLTFRLFDMLRHPGVPNDATVYPLHRTSLWSQLYGRAHVAHFAQHPPSWKNTTPLAATITRLSLVFALLPTAVLAAGMIRAGVHLLRPRRSRGLLQVGDDLLAVTAWGSIAFVIAYTVTYRDFATMKAEFLLPALPAFAILFADEFQRIALRLRGSPTLVRGFELSLAALLALYLADTVVLAIQLT